ncbi:MAG TPA: hypothetical protein VKZ53_04280 [Candidatus Angelobacter sp.]|nr:hypothetical protein [Candidatus Angelobacter sp.]
MIKSVLFHSNIGVNKGLGRLGCGYQRNFKRQRRDERVAHGEAVGIDTTKDRVPEARQRLSQMRHHKIFTKEEL